MTTDDRYRIIGAEESPYSVKVRSYCRYKDLPHLWMSRVEAGALYQEHAKLPLIPLVITPDGESLQDSTPIIATLEATHPGPSIYPTDAIARFMDVLLEEFADEWGNKWMFHYRWAREIDQLACSRRLAEMSLPQGSEAEIDNMATTIRARMVDRVWFVGSSPQTAKQIEASYKDFLELLEAHLATRPFLFGARPAFSDFALWGQLYNCHRDPTPREIMEVAAPLTIAWLERMQAPEAQGDFEAWETLAPTMGPLIGDQVAGMFLPWSNANARAIEAGDAEFTVTLQSGAWTQKPQKYHARSLAALKAGYQAAASPALTEALDGLGVTPHLI